MDLMHAERGIRDYCRGIIRGADKGVPGAGLD